MSSADSITPSSGRENQARGEADSSLPFENENNKQTNCTSRFMLCFIITVIFGVFLFTIDRLGVRISRQQTWVMGIILLSFLGLFMGFTSGLGRRFRSRFSNDQEQMEASSYNRDCTTRPMISRGLSAILEEEEEPAASHYEVSYRQLEQTVSRRIDLYSFLASDTTTSSNQDRQFDGASAERECQISQHIMVNIPGQLIQQLCFDEKKPAELEDADLPSYAEVMQSEIPPPYKDVDEGDVSS